MVSPSHRTEILNDDFFHSELFSNKMFDPISLIIGAAIAKENEIEQFKSKMTGLADKIKIIEKVTIMLARELAKTIPYLLVYV